MLEQVHALAEQIQLPGEKTHELGLHENVAGEQSRSPASWMI
jgi:hypothetical protein